MRYRVLLVCLFSVFMGGVTLRADQISPVSEKVILVDLTQTGKPWVFANSKLDEGVRSLFLLKQEEFESFDQSGTQWTELVGKEFHPQKTVVGWEEEFVKRRGPPFEKERLPGGSVFLVYDSKLQFDWSVRPLRQIQLVRLFPAQDGLYVLYYILRSETPSREQLAQFDLILKSARLIDRSPKFTSETVALGSLSDVTARHTPPELLEFVVRKAKEGDYAQAAVASELARLYYQYDCRRVVDPSLWSEFKSIFSGVAESIPKDRCEGFFEVVRAGQKDGSLFREVKVRLQRLGPPQYFPAYMLGGPDVLESGLRSGYEEELEGIWKRLFEDLRPVRK